MDADIGSLQRLPAREVFAHEAYDFTAWLEENVDALSDVIGIDLATAEREKTAGDFSADLLAEDEDGHRVIVENQLEQTDHKHLGQVLTYLTVLDAEIAIWITADARPEHVSAVSWLNENAGGADFYLVKVEGVQVDDSRPAPLFTRIVGPSPETRAAEQTKKEWDERDRVRYRFFEHLLVHSSEHTDRFDNISPKARGNISASGGRGFTFNYTVRQHESRAFLFIDFKETQAVNDAAYAVFETHRDEIESAVDNDLEWVQDENRRRLIRHTVDVGYENEDQWAQAHEELANVMAQLESAVEPYLSEAQREARQKVAEEKERRGAIGSDGGDL
jgi:hypothetical protein